MSDFEDQLARVERYLKRIENQDRDRTEYEDDLWSFFQNCWHLKDWIKNDGTIPETLRNTIEDIVKEYDSLMICADLANRTKHLKLKWTRKDASVAARLTVTIANKTIDGLETPIHTSSDYLIELGDGPTKQALSIARRGVEDWKTILSNHRLI